MTGLQRPLAVTRTSAAGADSSARLMPPFIPGQPLQVPAASVSAAPPETAEPAQGTPAVSQPTAPAADDADLWPFLLERGTAEPSWETDDEGEISGGPAEFPLDAFIIPEDSTRLPTGYSPDDDRTATAPVHASHPAPLHYRVIRTVRNVPDFPRTGVLFRDITPVIADSELFRDVIGYLADAHRGGAIDVVAGIESRGFIFGGALAVALGTGFVPIRKPGKLPHERLRVEYSLEYGADAVEAHVDAFTPGARVLLLDDVLATGGTAAAAAELVQRLGGHVVSAAFVLELGALNGRERLGSMPVRSLVLYD